MSAPVAFRSQYSHLFGSSMLPVLEEIFSAELEQHPSRRDQLFKVVPWDRDIWQSSEMHDLDLFSEVAEGTEYSLKRAKQGASKTLTMVKYGLGFSISREAVEDGKFDLIGDMVRKLARSGRESQEIQAMNIFNNGFSTETTADGVSVFNSSHTLPSGLTFRNRPTAYADLSESSLQTALSDFEQIFIGDSGIIENVKPRILLVHPSNKRYAMELIGSELKADTPNNNMNSLKGDGLIVVSSPHLTDSDAWFLLADAPSTGLRIIEREALSTAAAPEAVGFLSDTIVYKSSYREKIGVTHPKGIYGNSGA